jgi:hypothetical protein
MARQNINIGTTANDGSGDSLRVSFNKVNQNFIEVYSSIGSAFSGNYNDLANKPTLFSGSYSDLTNKPTLFSGSYSDLTNKPTNISSFTNDSGYITSSISDDFIPTADNEYDLGSPTNQWRSLYVSANTIFIGGTPLSVDENGTLLVDGSPVAGGGTTTLPFVELTNTAIITQPIELGETVSFEKVDYDTSNSAIDFIDDGIALTRGNRNYLYNPLEEETVDSDVSPVGTLWNIDGWGDLSDYRTRDYDTFDNVFGGNLTEITDYEIVMYDTVNEKYYKFVFSSWTQGQNGGGFAYTRNLIIDPNYFKKEDYDSGSTAIDIIIPDDGEGSGVGITRGNNNGIYNPYREEGWDSDISPVGTLWNIDGWDDLSDIETRSYANFYSAYGNGGLGNRVPGSRAVMYVPDNGKYYAVQWLGWTQGGNGGGFSYTRRELDLTKLNEGLKFADGTVLKTAAGIGRVKSTASGNRRIEEAAGSKTVSVTPITTIELTATLSRNGVDEFRFWVDTTTTTIDDIISDQATAGITDPNTIQFSLDNSTWYTYDGGTWGDGNERGYTVSGGTVNYTQGDTVYFRYQGGGAPVVWWDKNELPSGGNNFRGAVIDYHAYSGDATWIGTIHIADDSGDEFITHTETSSGSSDSQNDDLWVVNNEGTISYRRLDGEAKTLKVHWIAKVFYGTEYYD